MNCHLYTVTAALLAVLMLLNGADGAQSHCRMAKGARHEYCALPYRLGNFQGYDTCNMSVLVGRPKTLEEAQDIVAAFPRVKANGVGHSWWALQFCSGDNDTAINVVMTELKDTLDFILNPTTPQKFNGQQPPTNFPIHVDEDKAEVTVAAGIPQRMLLDYLSEYTYGKEPNGWTLEAFSWFIDQTIGGAVATGTHGSTFQHGSLSSQVTSLRLLLANGTFITLTPERNPYLFKAAAVSVGRLGIITDLTFKIVPQRMVTKSVNITNFETFAEQIKKVQDEFVAASGNQTAEQIALSHLDETQAFWHVIPDKAWRVDYTYPSKAPSEVEVNVEFDPLGALTPALEYPQVLPDATQEDFEQYVYPQIPEQRLPPYPAILKNPQSWGSIYMASLQQYIRPGTFEASKAYLSMSEVSNDIGNSLDPYNQFEVAIPFNKAGDCLVGVNKLVYGGNLTDGFRAPALIRFISGEDFYLSPSNGGPVMYVNLEDHLSLTSDKPNTKFDTVIRYFLDECDARFHWGKAGWPVFQKCFDGAVTYPDTWCDFGCAVQELDPQGKFRSESNVWRWNATHVNGSDVEFSSCCTAGGFNKGACTCRPYPIC